MILSNKTISQGKAPVPGKGEHQNPFWQLRWLLLVTLAILVVSGSYVISSRAASLTSNLKNKYLGPQRDPFPALLYRVDMRTPPEIFNQGFTAKGNNYDIVKHVVGGAGDSGYISTTGKLQNAVSFVPLAAIPVLRKMAQAKACSTAQEFLYSITPVLGPYLLAECRPQNQEVSVTTFVYEIDPASAQNAFSIPTVIKPNQGFYDAYQQEDEWAYVHKISPQAIVGVRLYQVTAKMSEPITPRNVTVLDHQTSLPNPSYGGTNPRYDPAKDSASGWSADTALNLPTSSCPADPLVAQPCS